MSCYDLIASEYYEARHKTCRNFDATTKAYLDSMFVRACKPLLEMCAGRGRSFEYTRCFADAQVDSSIEMLSLQPREPGVRVLSDARVTPFVNNQFETVTAFLCDPCLDLQFVNEVHRLLASGGLFLFTTPAFEWGTALRGGVVHETRFVMKDKDTVVVPSNLLQQHTILAMLGCFVNIKFVSATLPRECEPSDAVVKAAQNVGTDPYDLPLLYLFRAHKP